MGKANIARGLKWSTERAKAIFENRTKDVAFFDSQASIVNDIQEYENSKEPEVEIKSKGKK